MAQTHDKLAAARIGPEAIRLEVIPIRLEAIPVI